MKARWLASLVFCTTAFCVRADGPKDNLVDQVRPIPPAGVPIPMNMRSALEEEVKKLEGTIEELRASLKNKPALLELLPDVQIYAKAVGWALKHNEFHNAKEFPIATSLLKQGLERARALSEGKAPW